MPFLFLELGSWHERLMNQTHKLKRFQNIAPIRSQEIWMSKGFQNNVANTSSSRKALSGLRFLCRPLSLTQVEQEECL